jgi:hypothetical protein
VDAFRSVRKSGMILFCLIFFLQHGHDLLVENQVSIQTRQNSPPQQVVWVALFTSDMQMLQSKSSSSVACLFSILRFMLLRVAGVGIM